VRVGGEETLTEDALCRATWRTAGPLRYSLLSGESLTCSCVRLRYGGCLGFEWGFSDS